MAGKDKTVQESALEKSESISEYDPSLDFFSEHFDPFKALQTADIKVPVPSARTHDNLAKYDSVQRGISTEKKAKSTEAPSSKFERNFLPHQMPVKTEFKVKSNTLMRMQQTKGPLLLLMKCVDERTRVKIWVRHGWGIRGYCLAFISAFDKHWNMTLEDVTEVWTRPRKRKVPALGSITANPSLETNRQQNEVRKVMPSKIIITKIMLFQSEEFTEHKRGLESSEPVIFKSKINSLTTIA